MNNEEKIKALTWWQNSNLTHVFSCTEDFGGRCKHKKRTMTPCIFHNNVFLCCLSCKKLQSRNLNIVFKAYKQEKKIWEKINKIDITKLQRIKVSKSN